MTTNEGDRLLNEMNLQVYSRDSYPLTAAWEKLSNYMRDVGELPAAWVPNHKGPGRPALEEGQVKEGADHGTPRGYRAGCRCLKCRKANALRARRYQSKKKVSR